jgi:hypothetical protein
MAIPYITGSGRSKPLVPAKFGFACACVMKTNNTKGEYLINFMGKGNKKGQL